MPWSDVDLIGLLCPLDQRRHSKSELVTHDRLEEENLSA